MRPKGSVYHRCHCVDDQGSERFNFCRESYQHGSWYFHVDLPPEAGERRQLRRGGFESRQAAELALITVIKRMTPTPTVTLEVSIFEVELLREAMAIYRKMWGRADVADAVMSGLELDLEKAEQALMIAEDES